MGFKSISLAVSALVLSTSVNATLVSYEINANGSVINSSTSVRYFSGNSTGNHGYWGLNSADNTIFSTGAYGTSSWSPLATSLFQVSDITDITYMYDSQRAWITVSDGNSYEINANGSVINSSTSVRYFSGNSTGNHGYWGLNSADNTIFSTGAYGTSSWSPLATSLFQVSDITDITYMYDSQRAWITVDDGISAVPVPAAIWLFGSGLIGLIGVARRKKV